MTKYIQHMCDRFGVYGKYFMTRSLGSGGSTPPEESPTETPTLTALLFDDFETKDFTGWGNVDVNDVTSINSGAVTISSDIVHSGLYSCKTTLPASGNDAKLSLTISSFALSECYIGFYFYIDPAWNHTGTINLLGIQGNGNSASLLLYYSSGSYYLRDGNGTNGTHAVSLGSWHSVLIRYKAGSGNAIKTILLDNIQDINITNATLTAPFSAIYWGVYNASTATGIMYFDDFILDIVPITYSSANITVRHPNTACRSSLPLLVTMFGQVSTDVLIVYVDGIESTRKTGSMTGHEMLSITMSSLSIGDHTLWVHLQDSIGTTKVDFVKVIHKYVSGTSTVSIDSDNNISLSGSKIFPLTPF